MFRLVCLSLLVLRSAAQELSLPDPLVMLDGNPVTTAQQWQEERRDEILELFREHMHGRSPTPNLYTTAFNTVSETSGWMDGTATRKEVDITVTGPHGSQTIRLLLFLPESASKPVPLFLLLNHRDEATNTDPDRNNIEDFWPAEEVIARGYGIAAIGTDDIALDEPSTFRDPVINLFNDEVPLPDDAWRTIAAWAWGGSRAMDYFETDNDIDDTRIAVVGHSRGGKAAFWCGADDERFALTIGNDSGCNGAALSRRKQGADLAHAWDYAPYWFNENYKQYNDKEEDLPFDQHTLIALMAPRLVYIASATRDQKADPEGEFLSGVHAGPVYELFGLQGLGTDLWSDTVDNPIQTGSIGYHARNGDHDMTSYDWQRFMDFADAKLTEVIPPNTAPTKAPTSAPTEAPTNAPTSAPTGGPTNAHARASLGIYPGEADAGVMGVVTVTAGIDSLTITGSLSGLPANIAGGFHIHSGVSCNTTAEVGRHWYDSNVLTVDPWNTTYSSDASGVVQLDITLTSTELGYDVLDSLTHTVVVHSADGTNVACGVLGGAVSSTGASSTGGAGGLTVSASYTTVSASIFAVVGALCFSSALLA